ncbi:MAG: hypothetical protein J5I52_03990 [Saprospiraceae bacterium]|nr:hypothetical protein [Saprospiraceae bacterium]
MTGQSVLAQCGLDQVVNIKDEYNDIYDTTHISVLVRNATSNDLASPQQGVCGVQLKFKHPFMKELFIDLISPSGQVVHLTGGDIVATNTQLITWDVTFVPCAAAAAPDPGFNAQWENNQLWQNLTVYTGQYYPYRGCLEDFNQGSVNGVWTFRCIDFEDGGAGQLLDAKIIFCDDRGVSCTECSVHPGTILNEDLTVCEGSDELKININKVVPPSQYDTVNYIYTNVIFGNNIIWGYEVTPDLRPFLPGKYEICGLQIAKSQLSQLPTSGTPMDHTALVTFFGVNNICAGLSDHCIEVNILPQPEPISLSKTICKGEKVTINGTDYFQQGIYTISIDNGVCDSLIELDLKVIDLDAMITSDRPFITCISNTVGLIGSNTTDYPGMINYNWFTSDGVLSGDPSFFIIDANKAGTYFLEVSASMDGQTCVDTASFVLRQDDSFPVISFDSDTLTCIHDTINIVPHISVGVKTVEWGSLENHRYETQGNGIRVWEPGSYFIKITTNDGCIGRDTVTIHQDIQKPEASLSYDVLDCRNDSITIEVTTKGFNGDYSYEWSNMSPDQRNEQSPEVKQAGRYILTITDNKNGCTATFAAEVEENRVAPNILEVIADTIDCINKITNPIVDTDVPIVAYHWTGPGLDNFTEKPQINAPGIYTVEVTAADNGCKSSETFVVIQNIDLPAIQLSADSLTCRVDSVQLKIVSPHQLVSYVWTGPDQFTSTLRSPYVYTDGIYRVTVTRDNGCTATGAVEVVNRHIVPEITIRTDSIRCTAAELTIHIEPDLPDRAYQWSGPGLLTNGSPNPIINQPGSYFVTVTNDVTGCQYFTSVLIGDARVYTMANVTADTITCFRDSVRIIVHNPEVVKATFDGPNFHSEALSPFVKESGVYHFMLINEKGCITEGNIQIVKNVNSPQLSVQKTDFKCNQDSILINATSNMSGTEFTWKHESGSILTGSAVFIKNAGIYQLEGLAPNGCKSIQEVNIGFDTIHPVFMVLPVDTLTCSKPEVTLKTEYKGNGTIEWNPGNVKNNQLLVKSPGIYYVKVTGENNCSTLDSVEVIESKNFPTYESDASTINCKDRLSTITITPTSPYEMINWDNLNNPDQIDDNSLQKVTSFTGVYTFFITNDEGCVTSGSVEVIADIEMPKVLKKIIDTLDCNRKVIDIGVVLNESASSFLWNGPNLFDFITRDSVISVRTPGRYTVQISGENHCITVTNFEVILDENDPEYSVFTDTLTCDKGKINIGINAVTLGLEYLWSGPSGFSSTLHNPKVFEPGLYVVTITGKNGCVIKDSIDVHQIITHPEIIVQDTFYMPCDLSGVQLNLASEDQIRTYFWILPDGSLSADSTPIALTEGAGTVQIVDNYGCPSQSANFVVYKDPTPAAFDYTTDTLTCQKTVISLSASSEESVEYEWISPDGNRLYTSHINGTEAGDYTLIVTNIRRCKDTVIINVPIDTIHPSITLHSDGLIQCTHRNVLLDASGSPSGQIYRGRWTTLDGNISSVITDYIVNVDKSGTYYFDLTNIVNGCVSTESIFIDETPSSFNQMFAEVQIPYCEAVPNGSIRIGELNGIPPYVLFLNGQNKGNQVLFENLSAGTYKVEAIDNHGCSVIEYVEVPSNGNLEVTIDDEYFILFGDSLLLRPEGLNDLTGKAVLRWFKGDTLVCTGCTELWVRPFVNTVYTIEQSIEGLCKETVHVLVRVRTNMNDAIPNVFRPESSSGNERFYIPQTRGIKQIKRILIFDKWAENVYAAYHLSPGLKESGWDGTFNGKECEQGVYIVIAELLLSNGQTWIYKGDVTLLR